MKDNLTKGNSAIIVVVLIIIIGSILMYVTAP